MKDWKKMRHYSSLEEAFEELRTPHTEEMEGKFEMSGIWYYFSAKTIHANPLPESGEDFSRDCYKLWIERVERDK